MTHLDVSFWLIYASNLLSFSYMLIGRTSYLFINLGKAIKSAIAPFAVGHCMGLPDWFTKFTSTEEVPLLPAGPQTSSDSNVYDAMARFVRGRDDGVGRQIRGHPKCVEREGRRRRCPRCALNAACFGNASNPWHPDGGDCPPVWRWSRPQLEDSPRFRNLSVLMLGDSRIRVIFGALLRKFYALDDPVFT